MRLLITGGAGFIGAALIRYLLRTTNHEIINLDALTYAACPEPLAEVAHNPRYHFIHGDVRDAALLDRLFQEHAPDAVLHLAAESHVDRSIEAPDVFIATNINGTYELLAAARRYWDALTPSARGRFRFLHVSTDEVYGSLAAPEAASETSAFAPASPYAASKAAADHLLAAWHTTYGLPTLVTHGANTYGPFQHAEKLIPRMIEAALGGQTLPIYGAGDQIRDWLHVDDHVAALYRVLIDGTPGQRYNVAAGEPRSNLELVHALCAAVDQQAPATAPAAGRIRHVADRLGHDQRYALDTTRIRKTLGWQPQIRLDEGLADLVAWHAGRRAV